MSAQPQTKSRMTPEEYLALEKTSEIKSEYFDGEIFAMTGASLSHNRINRNMIQQIGTQLARSPLEPID